MIDPDREPSAQLRNAARQLREYYVALVREGFTEAQALRIIGTILSGSVQADKGP
jgi:hypothetical protein